MSSNKNKTLASRLRHRLLLQELVQTPDGAGGYTRSWQEVTTLWAEIEPLRGNETLEAAKLEAGVTHKIIIRYRAGITAAHRFVLAGTRAFNIRAVINVGERGEFLEIIAEEGVAT